MNILLTGGSSGIGKYLLKKLSIKHNIITCSSKKKAYFKKKKIKSYLCDVSNEESVKKLAKLLKKKKTVIDVIINCAGVYGTIGKFNNQKYSDWKRAVEVNLFGTFLICKHFLNFLNKSKFKRIINFSGGGAFNSFPNYSSYACSKAAVVRFTETIADELKYKGINVNCVAPGFVNTDIHKATINSGPKTVGKKFYLETINKMKKGGTPLNKIFKCINFLISKRTKFLTGKTISVNFDPWEKKNFKKNILQNLNIEALTMRRINLK